MARVLIIDDDADVQNLLRLTFQDKRGDEVLSAEAAAPGLTQAASQQPALIWVSLHLTGDVLTLLQDLYRMTTVPIVAYGVCPSHAEAQLMTLKPRVIYLPPPLPVAELLAVRDQSVTAAQD